jgi:NAD(P)-dependent dehydrogenase (short-subunit alcohol dehydrogenase family)
VTIVARNKLKLQSSSNELMEIIKMNHNSRQFENQRTRIIAVDVGSSEKIVVDAFQPVIDELGPVDVLINCAGKPRAIVPDPTIVAGTSIAGEFSSLDPEEFSRMIKINVLGSILPTRAVVEGMKLRRNGRIVFVSSQVRESIQSARACSYDCYSDVDCSDRHLWLHSIWCL